MHFFSTYRIWCWDWRPFPPVQFEWHLKIWTKSPLWCGTHQRQGNHFGFWSLSFFSIIVKGNFERSCTFTALGLEQRHFWGVTNSKKKQMPALLSRFYKHHAKIFPFQSQTWCLQQFSVPDLQKNFKAFFSFSFVCLGLTSNRFIIFVFVFFSILRLEACSSLLSFGAGQPYSVPGQSLPPTSYFRQRFVRNS